MIRQMVIAMTMTSTFGIAKSNLSYSERRIMQEGEERSTYRDRFTEVVRSLRTKPSNTSMFDADFQEADNPVQADTTQLAVG